MGSDNKKLYFRDQDNILSPASKKKNQKPFPCVKTFICSDLAFFSLLFRITVFQVEEKKGCWQIVVILYCLSVCFSGKDRSNTGRLILTKYNIPLGYLKCKSKKCQTVFLVDFRPFSKGFLWWNLSKNVQKILLMNLSLPRLILRDTVATSLNGLKDYLVHPIEPPEYDGLKSNYRCQFHKHFLSNFFIKNCYSNIFFTNSLLMYFFCWKAAHKMLVKSATGC